jgi:signal transduction histidine kinase
MRDILIAARSLRSFARPRCVTGVVLLIGFGASLGGFFAEEFRWLSLVVGLFGTLIIAGVLDLAIRRREEAMRLMLELATKNSQLDEALSGQAQAEQTLRQAQRMEAVGQLAGGIAHDFNNHLQAILSYSEFLSEGIEPNSDLQLDVAEVQKAARRAAGLTRQLLVFSRQHVTSPTVVDLNTSVRNAERLLCSTVGDDIRLSCETSEDPCPVLADAGELELVLMNLAINARDAMPLGGNIRVTVDRVDHETLDGLAQNRSPGGFARIGVEDSGDGMTPEVVAKAFEPFFTTKETGRGAGLGLSMVYGIASRSGGSASISTELGVGTTVSVLFPLANSEATSRVVTPAGLLSQDAQAEMAHRMAEAIPVSQ